MKIYEDKSNKDAFDKDFIKQLEDYGYAIDNIIYYLVENIISNWDKYPNICSKVDDGYYYDDLENLVVDRLLEIQDEVLEEAGDKYDIYEVLIDTFWKDTSDIDSLEYSLEED